MRKNNKKYLLILVSILCISTKIWAQEPSTIDYLSPKEYEIGTIDVQGTQYLDKSVLKSISGLRTGMKINIPSEDISTAIKNLWDQKLFAKVDIILDRTVGNTAFLIIKLEERPRLSRYIFKGIKGTDVEELRKKLNLTSGQIITENLKFTSAKIVKDYFYDKGFLGATVDMVEETDSTFRVNSRKIVINVNKGEKVKINAVNFHGNESISQSKLMRQMKDTREKLKFDIGEMLRAKANRKDPRKYSFARMLANISPTYIFEYIDRYANLNFLKTSKFDKNDYEKDKEKLITMYNNLGYRDARIVKDSVYLKDAANMNIDIYIEEGRQYYLRNIFWKGNQKYNDSTLNYTLNIKKGTIYDQALLDQKLQMSQSGNDVSSLYMDDGYLFFQVNPTEVLVENDSVDLEMRMFEGAQATINKITISGNTKTNEHVIRRELRIIPGDKFSRADLIRSQREISQLGYFDPEQIEIVPIPNPENGTVDIEFKVVEKPSDQLELSAGWGGRGNGIVGTAGVSFTNFSIKNIFKKEAWAPLPTGDGQKLSLRVQSNGKVYQSYNFSFTEPWLGGKKPNSLSLSFSRTHFNNVDPTSRKVDGWIRTTSATIAYGTRLKWPDDYFTFVPSINYQLYGLKNWTTNSFLFSDGYSHNLNINLALSRNSIDQPIYPRRGANLEASVQFTLPYSLMFKSRKLDYENNDLPANQRYKWLEYNKWKLKIDWYAPLSKNQKLVFRATAKFGFMFTYNQKLGLTPFERFQVGGDGISTFRLTPVDIISLRGYDVFTGENGAPIYNKFSMELRYPFSLNPSATIFALLFAEGGNAYSDIRRYNPLNLKRSVGAGVRIFLPMFGLLGFDYGIGFDNTPNNGTNIFSKYGRFRVILGFEPE
jgi:outer membrane protein insertion porin family